MNHAPAPAAGIHPDNNSMNRVGDAFGSRTAALAMVYKLIESARTRRRAVNAPHLVALVRAGACFERNQLVKRLEGIAA